MRTYAQIQTNSQVLREREEGEGKEAGHNIILGPGSEESSDFVCRDLRQIIFEDSGLCRLLGCENAHFSKLSLTSKCLHSPIVCQALSQALNIH